MYDLKVGHYPTYKDVLCREHCSCDPEPRRKSQIISFVYELKLQISHNILDLFYLFIYAFILVAYEALCLF